MNMLVTDLVHVDHETESFFVNNVFDMDPPMYDYVIGQKQGTLQLVLLYPEREIVYNLHRLRATNLHFC